MDRPHRETGSTPGIAMRPSRFLLGAMLGFAGVVGASVFRCVFAHAEHAGHASVACAATLAVLALASYRWTRAQPSAIGVLSDGITIQSRTGAVRHTRIVRYAQWSGQCLVLTLLDARERRETLVLAADSVDAGTFRQLSVQARRAAASHL
ncbi:protein YgfX [Caballeronia sp. INDeC2]|uniref:protein YgfX n=1 Tax=Caballeronia sp. INDeC2 TaxID=2921747 RepID=UPI0020280724|nr:protein YgfX [Caballeronia sp. INDeC2]